MRLHKGMNYDLETLVPPKRLALSYANSSQKTALALLLIHDVKLGQILKNGKEPLIGQMRLQWWRDVIAKPAGERPSGEPLLAQLGEYERNDPSGKLAQLMIENADAWDCLLSHEHWTDEILEDHSQIRAGAIFGGYASLVGIDAGASNLSMAGKYWALCELFGYCQTQAQIDAVQAILPEKAKKLRFDRQLRPLSLLYFGVSPRQPGLRSAMRIIIHGLTGR